MTKIVAIHGAAPVSDEPNTDLVEKCKDLLRRAESAELQGLVYVGFAGNRANLYFHGRITENTGRETLLYAVTMAHEQILRDCFAADVSQTGE